MDAEAVRIVDVLRAVAPLLAVFAVVLLRSRRRIIAHFENAGAFGSGSAIAAPDRTSRLDRWWLSRLTGSGVLHQVSADRYWFDRNGWAAYRDSRKTRGLVVTLAMIIVLLVAMYFRR